MRIAISKKMRFEVFKRDSFKCQYCGAKPPKSPMEVDHIIPVSKGGKNLIDNLITSCFNCNRGKSNKELNSMPEQLKDKIERIELAKKQYLQFQRLLKQQQHAVEKGIDMVEYFYTEIHENFMFTDSFRNSVSNFIDKLGLDIVIDSMKYSLSRIGNDEKVLKYFCGICWTKIRNNNE